MYQADEADTATLRPSLETARENVAVVRDESEIEQSDDDDDAPPWGGSNEKRRETIEVVTDKGYHKVELLLELRRAEYRTYIPVPDQKGNRTFVDKGGMLAREAFHDNRKRVGRKKGKTLLKLRGELIERTFALACETGAHRRLRLRSRDNARKRFIAHAAALNLGLVMRTLFGYGTPREMAAAIAAAWNVLLHLILASAVGRHRSFVGMALLPTVDAPIAARAALVATTGP